MCSILSGHRDWLRIGAVTNRDPGPGLTLESREEELWFCQKGWGWARSGYSTGRGMRSAWGSWWPSQACQGRAAGLRRALLSPGVESAGSCYGPGAPPETGGKPSARESSPACLSACLNYTGFSVQLSKWRPWKCTCVGFGWLQGRNAR